MNIKVTLQDCQKINFSDRINWKDYFLHIDYTKNIFDKDFLKNKFIKDISEFNIKINNNTMIDMTEALVIYIKNNIKTIKTSEIGYRGDFGYIEFFSPFFENLAKFHSDIFKEIFTIVISSSKIEENNLLDFYINKFKELNKLKINVESLKIEYSDSSNLKNYFKDFQINLNQLKKLEINGFSGSSDELMDDKSNFIIFPLIRDATNLIHLSINNLNINPKKFEFINNNKNLQFLKLINCYFESNFILNLTNLKYLEIISCIGIQVSKETGLKLKSFTYNIYFGEIDRNKLDLLSDLEEIKIDTKIINSSNNNKIYFNKLKSYKGNLENFNIIECPLLEKMILEEKIDNLEKFEMIMNKVSLLKFLKEISINLKLELLNNENISKIKFENNSIEKINLGIFNETNETFYLFSNFQNKFPKLSNLYIKKHTSDVQGKNNEGNIPVLQIKESPNSKVTNLNVDINNVNGYNKNYFGFNIDIQSYESLESFQLKISHFPLKLKIPIITEKCHTIFSSLKYFKLHLFNNENSFDIFKNIYNNIDKMHNLIEFSLAIKLEKNELKKEKKNFYTLFCEKVLSKKYIKKIIISLFTFEIDSYFTYSRKELIKIFPKVNFNKFFEVKICKNPDNICNIY